MFPGKNKLSISHETIGRLVLKHLQEMDKSIRIEDVDISYTGCEVRFTTDPVFEDIKKDPVDNVISEPACSAS